MLSALKGIWEMRWLFPDGLSQQEIKNRFFIFAIAILFASIFAIAAGLIIHVEQARIMREQQMERVQKWDKAWKQYEADTAKANKEKRDGAH